MQVVEPSIPSTPTVLRAVCSLKALLQNWHGNSHSFWSFGTPDTQIFPTQTNPRISCQEGNEGREVKPTTSWNENLMNLSLSLSLSYIYIYTWGRGWMTKASGVGERRKGRGELRRDCHHRVAALFVPTRMQQWYMIYNNDIYIYIYGGGGRGGPFRVKKHAMSLGSPGILAKARRL